MSLIGHQIASVSQRPGRSIAQRFVGGVARLADLRFFFGLSEALVIGLGLVLTICGSVWATQESVALPVVLMVAYCMLLTTVALAIALCVLRNAGTKTVSPRPATAGVNLPAWKLLNTFNVSNASRLWCNVEPGHPYTQEIGGLGFGHARRHPQRHACDRSPARCQRRGGAARTCQSDLAHDGCARRAAVLGGTARTVPGIPAELIPVKITPATKLPGLSHSRQSSSQPDR